MNSDTHPSDISSLDIDFKPPAGTIEWAQYQINKVYEPKISGPEADISLVHELPYVEAAAILSLDLGANYDRLRNILKSRGVKLDNWERRVRDREREIRKERVARAEASKKQKTKDEKTAAAAAQPTWTPLESTCQQPVDGYQLFIDIRDAIRKFVYLQEFQAIVAALWVLFTWIFEKAAENNPYLRIVSPESNCGKSTMLEILERLARAGWLISSSTVSNFYRKAQIGRITFLLDEADAFLQEHEQFRGVLDAAHRPNGRIGLSVKQGDDWVSTDINVFLPIVIASIKKLRRMGTVEQRSIHIWLKRATKAERKSLTKTRTRTLKGILGPITDRCARWALDNADKLAGKELELDFIEDGRDCDKWEPLIVIADYLNQQLGKDVRAIAAQMIGDSATADNKPLAILLLTDIKKFFDLKRGQKLPEDKNRDKYSSESLCEELKELKERPWKSLPAGKGEPKPINQTRLAFMLRDYQIAPHTIRIGDETSKGYERKDFEDTWSRYATEEPPTDEETSETHSPFSDNPSFDDLGRHNATTQRGVGESGTFRGVTETFCDDSKNGSKPYAENNCDDVADENPKLRDEKKEEGTDDLKAA